MPTWALIQEGSLSGPADIAIQTGVVERRWKITNTTVSGSGTTSDHTLGRTFYYLNAQGFFQDGSAFNLPVAATCSGGPIGRISRIRLVKTQTIKNVTACADGEAAAYWTVGTFNYFGRGTGYLQDTELAKDETTLTIADGNLTSLTIPLDADTPTAQSVVGNAVLRNIGKEVRFAIGGAVLVDFDFVMTGTITINGANNPFLAANDDFTLSANFDNGQTGSGTIILERMEADIDYENGVPTRVIVQGPASGDPMITWS